MVYEQTSAGALRSAPRPPEFFHSGSRMRPHRHRGGAPDAMATRDGRGPLATPAGSGLPPVSALGLLRIHAAKTSLPGVTPQVMTRAEVPPEDIVYPLPLDHRPLETPGVGPRALGAPPFARSRLSVNVNPSTLKWWRSQLRRGAAQRPRLEAASGPPAAAFVVREVCSPRTAPPTLRVCLRDSRVSIDVPAGADLAWLRKVVEALC